MTAESKGVWRCNTAAAESRLIGVEESIERCNERVLLKYTPLRHWHSVDRSRNGRQQCVLQRHSPALAIHLPHRLHNCRKRGQLRRLADAPPLHMIPLTACPTKRAIGGGLSTTQECCENGAGRTFISICTFPTSNSLFCIHVEDCPFSHCSSQTDDADQDAAGPDGQRRSPHNVLANDVGSSDSLCLGERWQDEVRRAHRAGPESGCRRAGAEGRVESEGVGREDLPRCRADRGRGRGQAAARPIDPERCLRDPVHGSELQDAQCVLRRSKRSRRC